MVATTLRTLCRRAVLLGVLAAPLAAQDARTAPPAAAEWRLLYATDTAGHPTGGEKAALVRAVRSGHPIRVGWKIPWRRGDGVEGVLEHAAGASFLTIHNGEVFAQLAPILGQTPSALEPKVTLRTANPQLWYGLVGTTGELRSYFMGGDSLPTIRVATEWYAPMAPPAVPDRRF